MEAARILTENPQIPHGPVRDRASPATRRSATASSTSNRRRSARWSRTRSTASASGEIEDETFSADAATVTITGVNIHPSIAKGRMINAVRLAAMFLDRLAEAAR